MSNNHSYEEIRNAVFQALSGKVNSPYDMSQFEHLKIGVAYAFNNNVEQSNMGFGTQPRLTTDDENIVLEVFWDLFRQGVITLGLNSSNPNFPFFKLTGFGKKIIDGESLYFSHDVSGFENIIKTQIPNIDDVTVLYLKEALQAFRSGCLLSSTVMLGVATEHTFLRLMEVIDNNTTYSTIYANVASERTILQKINKFKNILDANIKSLPSDIKEDLDTNFSGVLSVIRNFRNQSGHPSGKIIDREQVFVLLHLFVSYGKKMYQLMGYFK